MTEQCNGWTNHETWLANMWLNNEEYSYGVLCEALMQPDPTSRAEWLQERVRAAYMEMSCRVGESCMWSDLLTLSMSRVNWLEIVESQD